MQLRYRAAKAQAAKRGDPLRFLLLKHRQWGGTTEEQAQTLYLTSCFPGNWAATIAQRDKDVEDIFQIALRMYDGVSGYTDAAGDPLLCFKRKTENSQRLDFAEAGSRFIIGSAESKTLGHGKTLQKVHGSEFARWPNLEDMWAGITQAVPDTGEIVLETTANGAYGKFHELYQEAKTYPGQPWTAFFFRWLEDPQYQSEVTPEEERQILAEIASGQSNEEQALAQRLAVEGIILTAGQWKWRRNKRRELGVKFFEQYPEDDVSCFLTSGRMFFDVAKIAALPDRDPIAKHEAQSLWVYEQPITGREYVLWADPSEGIERGDKDDFSADGTTVESANLGVTDYTAYGIYDRGTGEDVAVGLARIGPKELARVIDTWGRRYNNALAVVERNNHGHAVLLALEELFGYPNTFHHTDRLRDDGSEDVRPGWPTGATNRASMLDELDSEIREELYVPRDARMKAQMRTFIVNAKGKAEASSGNHDDLVTGRAMGGAAGRTPRNYTLSGIG